MTTLLRAARPAALVLLAALGAASLVTGQTARPAGPAVVLDVGGEITAALADHVERGLRDAAERGASLIVLDVDTPGGRVDAAIRIADAVLKAPVPTLAVVTNAFSAGALIALSAEQLVMLPGSEIGAALPVSGAGGAIEGLVGEKVSSALRAKFRSVAQTRGRPADLAEGMVNPNREIPGVKAKGEILTLTAADAVRLKVADLEARTLPDAVRAAGFASAPLERVELTPAERAGGFLTQPLVAALLLGVGVVGLVVELLSPGLGLPGAVGGLSLLGYFAGGFLSGNGSGVAFLLFAAGLLLLAAEVTLFPGFGVAGLAGLASLLASVYLSYGEAFPTVAGLAVILIGLGSALAVWRLPRSSLTRRFLLSESLAGASASPATAELRGRYGIALSDLRPSGVADLEGRRVDVVTSGEWVGRGSRLEVIKVEGHRVVVRALPPV